MDLESQTRIHLLTNFRIQKYYQNEPRAKGFVNSNINHEGIMKIIDEEKKYQELRKSIRMMNSQRSDTEKI